MNNYDKFPLLNGLIKLTNNEKINLGRDLKYLYKLTLPNPDNHNILDTSIYHDNCRNEKYPSNVKCICGKEHLRYIHIFNVINIIKPIVIGQDCFWRFYKNLDPNSKIFADLYEIALNIQYNDAKKKQCTFFDTCKNELFFDCKFDICRNCRVELRKQEKYNSFNQCIVCDEKKIDPLKSIKLKTIERQFICNDCFKTKKCRDCNTKFVSMKFNKFNNIEIRCKSCYFKSKNN